MILNELKLELFTEGRDIWKEIKNAFPNSEFLEFKISFKNINIKEWKIKEQKLVFSLWDSKTELWILYDVTKEQVLQYLDNRKLIFQQFTL